MFDEYTDVKPAIMIKRALDLLCIPGNVFEVRIPKTKAGTISGYFNDTAKAASSIAGLNGKHQSIYMTMNPVEPALIARCENTTALTHVTTTDAEITRRNWFLIDLDPKRPAGISSTAEELNAAKERGAAIVEWLSSIGWPEPFQACSGNGWHLMYRCDEPNDDAARVDFEFATKMLSSIFTDDVVDVDTTSFNSARVWKVYGTISMKGSSTAERPHRVATLQYVPSEVKLVTRDQLDNVARPLRDAKQEEFRDMTGEYIPDMVKWLTDRGQTVISGPRPMFGNDGQKWLISRCPFNPGHQNPMVGLVNNRAVFRCLHHSCSAFRWKEFREKIDPTYKDPETVEQRLKEWCDGDAESVDGELLQAACAIGKKLDPIIKGLRKECARARVELLVSFIKEEKRRFIRETIGENNEKGNIVGLINRTRTYQADGGVPMYWTAEYDHRVRVGPVGDIECPKADDAAEIALMIKFHSAGDSWVKQTHTSQVIKHLANEYRVNPLKVFLKSKVWDGVKRLDTWLAHYMGTKDDEYTRAIGRKWMIAAVARAMDPGCQADHMLIFEGAQGIGKSRAVRILGGQFYTEYSGNIKTNQKDMVHVILGKMIVEMSELATIRRADIESLKAMLTTCVDDARLSYERDAKSYPRTCVFVGTTNEQKRGYIADTTGARRFWPCRVAECGEVRTEQLAEDVDQLWAEAIEAYESGEDWFTVPKDAVLEEQAQRQINVQDTDPWYQPLLQSLTDPDMHGSVYGWSDDKQGITINSSSMLLSAVIGMDLGRQTYLDSERMVKVMLAIGFDRVRSGNQKKATYCLSRQAIPHLWDAIEAASKSVKFPRHEKES